MLKSFSVSALILFCTAIVESAILSNITILPAVPDFLLLCVLYISIHNGKLMGESTGFISGLFLDFMTGTPFGLNSLIRTIIGYAGGFFNKTLNTNGIFIPSVLGLSATVIKALLLLFVNVLYPNYVSAFNPFSWVFLFELIANTLLAPVVFRFLSLFEKSILLKPENII